MLKSQGIIITMALCALTLVYSHVYPCDVAVVSARASSTGRPFLWKNRDCSANWKQEVKYYNAEAGKAGGAYVMVCAYDQIAELNNGNPDNPSGGVNENGFAISCTSVYEELNPVHEAVNVNTDLIRQALQECATLDDFDALLKVWHLSNLGQVISGNFVAIDAQGGAALYECYTGMLGGLMPIQFRKYDANDGKYTNWAYGIATTDINEEVRQYGFVNRANSNSFIPYNYGEERRWRAKDLLIGLAEAGNLNYRTLMTDIAKDVNGQQVDASGQELDESEIDPANYSTTYCISRAATRLSMVVDGVASGGDPRLSVFWCALGEPSVSVHVPYFVHAGEVSYLSYMDAVDLDGNYYNWSDTSFLDRAANRRETYRCSTADNDWLYDSNTGDAASGMDDRTMNKNILAQIQEWTFPIEAYVFQKTEEYLADLTAHPSYITAANMRDFSNYCAEYVFANYEEASPDYYAWNFSKPWDEAWSGYTRDGFNEGILSGLANALFGN